GHPGVGYVPESLLHAQRNDVGPRRNRDVLLAIERVGHRRRFPCGVGWEAPQRLSRVGFAGAQGAPVLAENNEAVGSSDRPAPRKGRTRLWELPLNRAGLNV